ncbi:MAG: riboflavin synthase [Actinobacteria bacterium]|nr:riboflavin synthase [Actinomycetota bacterium]MCI0678058.1 riboflavin synthase [Actinomycetota bacterium]
MFTGIIEQKGRVAEVGESGAVLVIDSSLLAGVSLGGSVAVNGVCLTLVEHTGDGGRFDVVAETRERTNLARLEPGSEVNLELPMAADGRFDGHMVQGHVDGVGEVVALKKSGDDVVLTLSAPQELMEQIVEKGSITVDGVSLTVARVGHYRFDVALIPRTLGVTTLGSLVAGDVVNLETDIVAKYVRKIIEEVR